MTCLSCIGFPGSSSEIESNSRPLLTVRLRRGFMLTCCRTIDPRESSRKLTKLSQLVSANDEGAISRRPKVPPNRWTLEALSVQIRVSVIAIKKKKEEEVCIGNSAEF